MIDPVPTALTETLHHIMPLRFRDHTVDIAVAQNIRVDVAALAASHDQVAALAASQEPVAALAAPHKPKEEPAGAYLAPSFDDEESQETEVNLIAHEGPMVSTAETESESAEANLEAAISEGVSAANLELKTAGAEAQAQLQAQAEVSAADVTANVSTEVTEDFEMEPLPEAMAEASPVIAQKLGSLTLPAALCDEDLLGELARIPNKMGFKIGEVAEMLGIKQYVLRYWETEFDVLKPKKAANNQRYYTKKDVENVYLIRKLLHRDRFSIEGARSAMKDLKNVVKKEKDWNQVNHKVDSLQERMEHLIQDLRKLHRLFA